MVLVQEMYVKDMLGDRPVENRLPVEDDALLPDLV